MAAYEVLLLNTAIPQIQAAQSGDTYVVPRDIAFSAALTLSAGTANGVPYLNGSKVVTTGSALTFDGTGNLICAGTVTGNSFTSYTNSADGGVQGYTGNARALFGGGPPASSLGVRGETNILFGISATERARITSGGVLLVGTTTASAGLAAGGLEVTDRIAVGTGSVGTPALHFVNDSNTGLYTPSADAIGFSTGGTEKARITSGGYFKASNTGTYVSSTSTYHELRNDANANTVRISNSIASGYTDAIIQAQFSAYTPNAATAWFLFCDDTTNQKAGILSTGTFESRTSTYGGVSDVKLKTNIVDANSQWNDLKAVRVRNFAFKDEPNTTMLGVVAQEIEEVSPGLVYETPDRDKEGNDLGTTTKSVKYSILYMKAIKALQEAMARIETLEAKIAVLESKGV